MKERLKHKQRLARLHPSLPCQEEINLTRQAHESNCSPNSRHLKEFPGIKKEKFSNLAKLWKEIPDFLKDFIPEESKTSSRAQHKLAARRGFQTNFHT